LQGHASTLSYTRIAHRVLITLLCVTLKLHASYQASYSLNVFESKHEVCLSLSYYTRPIYFRCRASRETDRYNTHRKTVTSFSMSNDLL